MAVAYSMTQDSKTSGEQATCLTLLESAERIFYDRLDDAIRSASMFDETEYKAFCLVGNGTVVSYQCHSMDEAVDMVAALYNGRKNRSSASITILQKYMPFIFLGGRLSFCEYSDSVAKRADFASSLVFCGMISSSLILCGQLHSRANCIQWELENKKSDARMHLQ